MHRIRGLAGTALVLPALLTLSGCAAVRVCAEAESGPPRIVLDATAWIHDHPGQALQACLAARCAQLTEGNAATVLQAPASDTAGTYALTISTAGTVVAEESLRLADPTISGPCGDARVVATKHLTLDGAGRISEVPPTAPHPPSPTPSTVGALPSATG